MWHRVTYPAEVRVGMICPYSLSVPGGVQGQALGLARALREIGHEVSVLGPCDGPPPEAGIIPVGVSIPTAANGSVAPIAPDVSAQLRTIRAMRDEEFEVLHLHEPLCPGPTQTAVLFRLAPIVGTFHAAGDSLGYELLRPMVRWGASRLSLRCAVSEDAKKLAEAALGGDYELVFNGVEVDRYAKAVPWARRRGDGPTILFLGRHEPRKGLAMLLDAVRRLGPEVRVWIAGDGPETEALKARHAGDPRLEWLGRIPEEEKLARLRAADVFCAPSLRGESFGVVLLEAMAAGTPVVACDLPGYANVARANRDALLVPVGDDGALAEALRRVFTEPGLADRVVASGSERAAEFSVELLAESYVALYERVLGR